MKDSCSLYSKGTRFATEFPCPRGYYNPDPMTQSLDSCLPCPPGHYCGKENLTAASGKCDAGESGSVWLLYCTALGGSMFGRLMLISCSFYHSFSSLLAWFACMIISGVLSLLELQSCFLFSGWFCISAAWTSQPFDLDNYTNANCLCPATATGGKCIAGFYCPKGSPEPLPCPPGFYCNASG